MTKITINKSEVEVIKHLIEFYNNYAPETNKHDSHLLRDNEYHQLADKIQDASLLPDDEEME